MGVVVYADREIPVDDDGYLTDSSFWDESLAEHIASLYDVKLTEEHWWVIHYIRKYFFENGFLPTIRVVVNAMRREGRPKEQARDKYLYVLFPRTPIRLACKIAGLMKPPPGFVCL